MNDPVRFVLGLLIGAVGGALAFYVQLPLPWMLGSMIATTIAASGGLQMHMPNRLAFVAVAIVGVMLGSRVSPEFFGQVASWTTMLILLVPFILCTGATSYLFYRKVAKFDPVTAYFSAMPGGLNDMMILGAAAGGDERRIALAHAARVLFVIGFVGLFFGLFLGIRSATGDANWVAFADVGLTDATWLIAAGVVGIPVGKMLRLPAPQMLGPMIMSAIVHLGGIVEIPPPTLLLIVAQIVLGTRVGSRFAGVSARRIGIDLGLSAVSSLLMILVALGFAWVLVQFTNVDLALAYLAYAPGGFIEMSLLTLAMGQEVAYVSLAHTVRIILVISGAPLAARWAKLWDGKRDE